MFRVYDEWVHFNYLKSFGRVRVIYTTKEQAQLAQDNLNNQAFEGSSLQLRPVKVSLNLKMRGGSVCGGRMKGGN